MPNFTRKEIKRSFIKLLSEHPLNQISVRDIVEEAISQYLKDRGE